MLTGISGVTAALAAILNVAVLMGWDLTVDQVAGINTAIVAIGVVIHSYFNPDVPVGVTKPSTGGTDG